MNANDSDPGDRQAESHNILIVDDVPVNLGVVVEFLQSYGFGIRIARSGESALRRVQYDPPDIILLDVLLPGIDGFETCRRLKGSETTEDIPVIFMTSLTGTEEKVRAFEVGAVDYVTKPLGQEEVLARVTTHLRLADLTRRLRRQNRQLRVASQAERARLFEAVAQQREQLRALAGRLTEVQEAERKQLARELHDEMGQALTAISINLATIDSALPEGCPPRIRERLEDAASLTDRTLEQIRELSLDLRPSMLDDFGLVPTLRWYIKRYASRVDIRTELNANGCDVRFAPAVETTLYRVLQEALTNVARHAQAEAVHLSLYQHDGRVCALIEDDGVGFDLDSVLNQNAPEHGAGLLGIRERVALLDGDFEIDTRPGQGTRLSISIPL